MLSKHQLQAALARCAVSHCSYVHASLCSHRVCCSLDLSDEEEEGEGPGDELQLNIDPSDHGRDAAPPAADEPRALLDAARYAVVEDLQVLLCSMQSAVDDQVHSRAHFHTLPTCV
jgi:hypothetical protein